MLSACKYKMAGAITRWVERNLSKAFEKWREGTAAAVAEERTLVEKAEVEVTADTETHSQTDIHIEQ